MADVRGDTLLLLLVFLLVMVYDLPYFRGVVACIVGLIVSLWRALASSGAFGLSHVDGIYSGLGMIRIVLDHIG